MSSGIQNGKGVAEGQHKILRAWISLKENISTAYSIISEGNLIFLVTGSIQTLSVYSSTWKTDFVRELKFHKFVTYWQNKIGMNYDSRATK